MACQPRLQSVIYPCFILEFHLLGKLPTMAVELFLSGFLFGVVLLLGQLPAKADESDLPKD